MNSSSKQIVCTQCNGINRVPTQRIADNPLCGKCKSPLLINKPIEANIQNFQRLISKSELPVIVDFWAPWCGPCLQFAPTFAEVSKELIGKAIFVKLDTEANQAIGAQYGIRSIPTLAIFNQGKEIERLSGALPKGQFIQWINQYI